MHRLAFKFMDKSLPINYCIFIFSEQTKAVSNVARRIATVLPMQHLFKFLIS